MGINGRHCMLNPSPSSAKAQFMQKKMGIKPNQAKIQPTLPLPLGFGPHQVGYPLNQACLPCEW